MAVDIKIDPTGSNDATVCDCCGQSSRTVWGFAYTDDRAIAAYFVHWTLGYVTDQKANIDLIIGEWGEAAVYEHRCLVALAYRLMDSGPSMMVIDAGNRPASRRSLVGQTPSRQEVVGTPLAQHAFAIADAILAQDIRVAGLLGNWTIAP